MEQITSENYVEHAMTTDCKYDAELYARMIKCARLQHAAMGLVTEAGEFMDMLKKHIYYGKPLDLVNAKEENGDSFWYLALAMDELSTTMNEVLTLNINKLKLRYPAKFSSEDAINRDIVAERELLERKTIYYEDVLRGKIPEKLADDIINVAKDSKRGLPTNEPVFKSNRANDWLQFAFKVAKHIENYTVPQYGDRPNDLAEQWSPKESLDNVERYIKRFGKNSREGQQSLDFMKMAHYIQLASTKFDLNLCNSCAATCVIDSKFATECVNYVGDNK